MKITQNVGKQRGITMVELIVVIVCVALLAGLLVPATKSKAKTVRIVCMNNLRQVGLAIRGGSDGHSGILPLQFYTSGSGGLNFANATNEFLYFQAMSNVLSTPKVLACPGDTRSPASNFGTGFNNSNVSYFLGLDAGDESQPAMFLTGDRNLTNGTPVKNGILTLTTNSPAGWTMEMHRGNGNIALSDGSVQPLSTPGLRSQVAVTGTNVNRLLMP